VKLCESHELQHISDSLVH